MNQITLIGNIVKDPELKYAQNGTAVVKFTVATNRRFDKDKSDFHNCVAFKKTAEFVSSYLHKGDKVAVVGEYQNNNWKGQDGKTNYSMQIVVDHVESLTYRKKEEKQQGFSQFATVTDEDADFVPF